MGTKENQVLCRWIFAEALTNRSCWWFQTVVPDFYIRKIGYVITIRNEMRHFLPPLFAPLSVSLQFRSCSSAQAIVYFSLSFRFGHSCAIKTKYTLFRINSFRMARVIAGKNKRKLPFISWSLYYKNNKTQRIFHLEWISNGYLSPVQASREPVKADLQLKLSLSLTRLLFRLRPRFIPKYTHTHKTDCRWCTYHFYHCPRAVISVKCT